MVKLSNFGTHFHQFPPILTEMLAKMVFLTPYSFDSISSDSKNSTMLKITNFGTHFRQFPPILTEMLEKMVILTLGSIDSAPFNSQISPMVKLTNFGTHFHQFWRKCLKNSHFDTILNRLHFFWLVNFTHDENWPISGPNSINLDSGPSRFHWFQLIDSTHFETWKFSAWFRPISTQNGRNEVKNVFEYEARSADHLTVVIKRNDSHIIFIEYEEFPCYQITHNSQPTIKHNGNRIIEHSGWKHDTFNAILFYFWLNFHIPEMLLFTIINGDASEWRRRGVHHLHKRRSFACDLHNVNVSRCTLPSNVDYRAGAPLWRAIFWFPIDLFHISLFENSNASRVGAGAASPIFSLLFSSLLLCDCAM